MKFLTRFFDDNRIGALLLTALGVGFYAFLPETVVAGRHLFAVAVVALTYRESRKLHPAAWRYGTPATAAVLMIFLLFFPVETGAKIALGGWFLLIFLAAVKNMLSLKNKAECAASGAAGIAALLFAISIWSKIARFDLIECRKVFCVTLLAGALTLALQPFKRSEK